MRKSIVSYYYLDNLLVSNQLLWYLPTIINILGVPVLEGIIDRIYLVSLGSS
jgi:hypothetical protein